MYSYCILLYKYFDNLLNVSEEGWAELAVLEREGIRLKRMVESKKITVDKLRGKSKRTKFDKAAG